MKRTWMAALAAFALAGGSGVLASAVLTPAASPPRAPEPNARAPLAGEQSAYEKLVAEYTAARNEWSAKAKEAKDAKQKPPPRVEPEFWKRFEELGKTGDLEAQLWCVGNLRYANLSNADLKAKVPALCEKVVEKLLADEQHKDPSLAEIVQRMIPSVVSAQYLSMDQAQALLKKVGEQAKLDENKAAAMLVAGTMANDSIEDEDERALKNLPVYKQVLAKYPNTAAGREAKGEVNVIENLAIGKTAPDFSTKDVEDVAFKLGDYRGKVVVLDFWGFW